MGDETAAPNKSKTVTIRNLLPNEVVVKGRNHELHISALDCATGVDRSRFDEDRLRDSGQVGVVDEVAPPSWSDPIALVIVAASIALPLIVAKTDGWLPVFLWVVASVAAITVVIAKAKDRAAELGRWAKEKMALGLVLILGFGIPAVVVLFTTGLYDDLDGNARNAINSPVNVLVTIRGVQVLFLGIAITFPAMLYFLFDRQRADTLRTRFVFNIFRFDKRLKTRSDVDAYYGRQMEETFGASRSDWQSRQLRFRHRSPMVVTTIVLAIGWVVAFVNLSAISLSGGNFRLSSLFAPDRSVIVYGFLGAYFFAVNSVLRSYVRGDLQPKAYSQITARVLIVAVLTFVIALNDWGTNSVAITVAFFAGIVPDTILQWLWESVRKYGRGKSGPDSIGENQPLTELDGIDLYERARLAGEGVGNIEALAHGNLVDLLLQTRIPAGRLIDWVDQAILYLHTTLRTAREPAARIGCSSTRCAGWAFARRQT